MLNFLSLLFSLPFAFGSVACFFKIGNTVVSIATAAVCGAFFFAGFKKIEPGCCALVLFLGVRTPIILKEGPCWTLSPVFSLKIFNTKIRELTDNTAVISKNNVRLNLTPTILFKIINPKKLVDVIPPEAFKKDGVIDDNEAVATMQKIVVSAIGTESRYRRDDDIINNTEDLSVKVIASCEKKIEIYGIKIIQITFQPSQRISAKLAETVEELRKEEAEQEAELKEGETVETLIAKYLKLGYSKEDARMLAQTERGKVQEKKYHTGKDGRIMILDDK